MQLPVTNYQLPIRETLNPESRIRESKFRIPYSKKGFTLVEMVVVISIISVVLVAILGVYLNVLQINKSTQYYSEAYKILDSKIEEIRNTPFASVAATPANFSVSLPNGQGTVAISNNVEGAPQANILQVTVTVAWNYKKAQQIQAATYITNGGIKR